MSLRVAGARDCAPGQKWAKREGFVAFSTTTTTTSHYTPIHYTTLHNNNNYNYNLHYIPLHYTPLHYTALNYTQLHYITLHSSRVTHMLWVKTPLPNYQNNYIGWKSSPKTDRFGSWPRMPSSCSGSLGWYVCISSPLDFKNFHAPCNHWAFLARMRRVHIIGHESWYELTFPWVKTEATTKS